MSLVAHVCTNCKARWLPAALRYQTEKMLPECPACGGFAPAEAPKHRDCEPPPPSSPIVEVRIPKEPPTLTGKGRTGNWQRIRTNTEEQSKAGTVRPGKRS
jgi:hypothetical protein